MRAVSTKRALRHGLPLCVVCLTRWVAKAHRLTCGSTCRRIYRARKLDGLMTPEAPQTLTFPKESVL